MDLTPHAGRRDGPCCGRTLQSAPADPGALACDACHGILVPGDGLLALLDRRVLAVRPEPPTPPPDARSALVCPLCRERMGRFRYLESHDGVELDECTACEVMWIDGDEVDALVAAYAPSARRHEAVDADARERALREREAAEAVHLERMHEAVRVARLGRSWGNVRRGYQGLLGAAVDPGGWRPEDDAEFAFAGPRYWRGVAVGLAIFGVRALLTSASDVSPVERRLVAGVLFAAAAALFLGDWCRVLPQRWFGSSVGAEDAGIEWIVGAGAVVTCYLVGHGAGLF